MKIAMIGHKRIPAREGGIEIVVEELATRMVLLGHTVDVYNRKGHHVSGETFDTKIGKIYKGINIKTISTFQNSKLNAVVYSIIATSKAIFQKYDVIHFHAEGPSIMIWLPHLLGIRTVATIHGLDWKRAKWGGIATKIIKLGEKIAVKYADEIIVLSKNVQEYFIKEYNRKTTFVPNGVVKPTIMENKVIKQKWNIEKNGYILFLARLVPEKGLHYLIDAFKQIDAKIRLVIAGGSSHTDKYMEEIKRKVAIDNRIIMTGFVEGEELKELYSNAYIYVLPSDLEGLPISLLEAMSYGNCCLVSDIPENMEVVNTKALSFRKGDVHSLKIILKNLCDDYSLVEKYRIGVCDYVCQKYNWSKIVEQTINIYRGKINENTHG